MLPNMNKRSIEIVLLKESGILRINEEHTYDTTLRSDIYVEVFLV